MNDSIFEDLHLKELNNKDPYNFDERSIAAFSDELIIRKAKIYKIMGPGDDRLQVLPLPEFMGLSDEEKENLPIYPMFFKGQVITGDPVIDKSSTKETDPEFVWCMCTKDFSVGYILGRANNFGAEEKKTAYSKSYSWGDIQKFLSQRLALPDQFDYKNLIVNTFFASDKGGMIDCYNRKTGDWVLLNTTGAILTVQQKKIMMRVGSPPNPTSSGPVGFSLLEMTGDKILMKSPNIELDATDLVLGKHALNLVGTLTQGPVIGRNGVPDLPMDSIHV
jgi:hypothetical protein